MLQLSIDLVFDFLCNCLNSLHLMIISGFHLWSPMYEKKVYDRPVGTCGANIRTPRQQKILICFMTHSPYSDIRKNRVGKGSFSFKTETRTVDKNNSRRGISQLFKVHPPLIKNLRQNWDAVYHKSIQKDPYPSKKQLKDFFFEWIKWMKMKKLNSLFEKQLKTKR